MRWRAIGKDGEDYPAWLRAAARKSGVYAIRTRGLLFTTVVYVGESHTGNLYKTLTRHFQAWGRSKSWWRGQFAPNEMDPGRTYTRGDCEVAFQVCPASRALAMQSKWIRARPRRSGAAVARDRPSPSYYQALVWTSAVRCRSGGATVADIPTGGVEISPPDPTARVPISTAPSLGRSGVRLLVNLLPWSPELLNPC